MTISHEKQDDLEIAIARFSFITPTKFQMKIFLTTLLAFCMLTSFSQIPSYVPTNGLVAYYPFNGNANDESGNGNNGTVNGATLTSDRFGITGKAYSFNGSTTISEYILMNNPIANTSSFTLSYWLNRSSISNTQWHLMFISSNATFECFSTFDTIGFRNFNRITSAPNFDIKQKVTFGNNDYVNVIITTSNSVTNMYINGVLLQTLNYPLVIPGTGNLFVGKHANFITSAGASFNGKLDDIAIYNRALSAQEIADLYAASAPQKPCTTSIAQNDTTICRGGTLLLDATSSNNISSTSLPSNLQNGLVGYWPFNGNANDESGNGKNGTVNGATLTTDRFGNTDKAYEFYTFSGTGGYISAPNILLGDTFTISSKVLWYNLNISNASSLVSNHDGYLGYELNIIYSLVREHYSNVHNAHFTDSTIPHNEWHQITWVKTGSISRLYLDNRLISTKSNISTISNANISLFFGRAGWGGNILKGKLDDIAIWTRALTPNEVQQFYNGTTYLWSTGATMPTINVSPTQTTTYYVTVNNGTSSCTDSVTVTVNHLNPNLFAQDTIRTCSSSYTLDAGSGYSSYSWNNGSTSSSINVSNTGWYKCTVTNEGCTGVDSVFVNLMNAQIYNNDTSICSGSSILLQAKLGDQKSIIRTGVMNLTNSETTIVDTSIWHQLTLTKSGSTGSYYLDGNLINTTSFTSDPLEWYRLYLGATQACYWCSTVPNFKGFIDEVRISNRARSGQEILTNYLSNQPFSIDSSTLAYFNFNQTSGTSISNPVDNSIATLYGGMNLSSGKFGSAVSFDGLDDYILYSKSIPTDNMSLELWFKSSDTNGIIAMLQYDNITQLYLRSEVQTISYNNSLLWSTGETAPNIIVSPNQTTTYHVTVNNGTTSCVDSVTVTVNDCSIPCNVSISQNDTTICSGANLTLNVAGVTSGSVTDVDGNVYPTVNIGTQTWMQSNLKVSRYNNGLSIPQVADDYEWLSTNIGATCWNNNDNNFNNIYGRLYNWYAVADTNKLCPIGWHVPDNTEWYDMALYLGGVALFDNNEGSYIDYVADKIRSTGNIQDGTGLWITPNPGANNITGFTGLPGGYRDINYRRGSNPVLFYPVGWGGGWFSKDLTGYGQYPNTFEIYNGDSRLRRYSRDKRDGLSVRCLKNIPNTYLWSTGATTPTISISPTQTTTYYVTVNNGTSSCTDSVTVTVNSGNFFLQDTIRHCGASYALSAGAGYSSYLWSTGSTTSTITATTSKWYVCTVNQNGCTFTDSVYLQITNPASIPVPASITIQSIQTNVCGSRRYRYIAPALPVNATGYQWSFVGSLFNESATLDSGNLNSRIITVTYSSNSACGAGDSVKLRYNTVCGFGNWRALKLSNTALLPPNAPASITVQSVAQNNCGARKYRYIAPLLPAATATTAAATGWQWELAGSLSEFATIDSGDENSRIIVVVFSINGAAQSGDSIKLYYQSDCGLSKARAMKLTNLKLGPPITPASCTIQPIQTNVCSNRKYRFFAPILPGPTNSNGAATGWQWTMPTGPLGESAVLDSGTMNGRVIIIRFNSNAAAAIGDSIRVRYLSNCGFSLYRAIKLTNTALNPPMAPASITIQSVATNICGFRKYRYIAPVLPAATTANGVATGWQWTMPSGTLGATATLDSGSLNGNVIVISYSSNAASGIGDSIRLRFNSGCGYGAYRALKLNNVILNPPLAPASITMTLVQNDCGVRIYRYTAPALPAATTVNGAATGYAWTMPFGPLGSQGTLDSGTLTSRTIRIIYPSNDASQEGDSIRVRYNSVCGLGLNKTSKLSNTVKTGCPPVSKPAIPYAKTTENQPKTNQLSVLLYPNPSADQFYLKLSSESKSKVMIRIFDVQGKRVQQMEALPNGVTQIGNGLKPGTYMMQVHQDGEVQTRKLVKI